MIQMTHFIIYVDNQDKSTTYYSNLLKQKPQLNEPGMTEFKLTENSVLGLMPFAGAKRLFSRYQQSPVKQELILKAEIYLVVDDISPYYEHAKSLDIDIVSKPEDKDWGHRVFYIRDIDNYIVAFAHKI